MLLYLNSFEKIKKPDEHNFWSDYFEDRQNKKRLLRSVPKLDLMYLKYHYVYVVNVSNPERSIVHINDLIFNCSFPHNISISDIMPVFESVNDVIDDFKNKIDPSLSKADAFAKMTNMAHNWLDNVDSKFALECATNIAELLGFRYLQLSDGSCYRFVFDNYDILHNAEKLEM